METERKERDLFRDTIPHCALRNCVRRNYISKDPGSRGRIAEFPNIKQAFKQLNRKVVSDYKLL
jgi:hypothetical protein